MYREKPYKRLEIVFAEGLRAATHQQGCATAVAARRAASGRRHRPRPTPPATRSTAGRGAPAFRPPEGAGASTGGFRHRTSGSGPAPSPRPPRRRSPGRSRPSGTRRRRAGSRAPSGRRRPRPPLGRHRRTAAGVATGLWPARYHSRSATNSRRQRHGRILVGQQSEEVGVPEDLTAHSRDDHDHEMLAVGRTLPGGPGTRTVW